MKLKKNNIQSYESPVSKGLGAVLLFSGEERIHNAIKSVLFCDEIVIVHDCASGEKNTRILDVFNGRIRIVHKRLTSFSDQRNFGLNNIKSNWVFFLDADEMIPEKTAEQIIHAIKSQKNNGYMIRRVDTMWGKRVEKGELLNVYILRLGRKNSGKWHGVVHEEWKIDGKIGKINSPILHFPHQTVSEFLYEINTYTTLRAEELARMHKKTNFLEITMYPSCKFVWNYFFKGGFLEGNRGFIIAMMMSFHSFLVRSKRYSDQKKLYPHIDS